VLFFAAFEGFFEFTAGFEFGNDDRRNFNFGVRRTWVDTHAFFTAFGREAAETSNDHFVALFQCVNNGVGECVHQFFDLFFWQADFFGKFGDEFGFVHMILDYF